MDAVLMKLHDADPCTSDSAPVHWDCWLGFQRHDCAESFTSFNEAADQAMHGSLVANIAPMPGDWLSHGMWPHDCRDGLWSSSLPFESVGDMGYKSIQECIDGLPLGELHPFADGASVFPGQWYYDPPCAGGGKNLASDTVLQVRKHQSLTGVEANAKQGTRNAAFMDSILRVLHESHEDDSTSTSAFPDGGDNVMQMQWPGGFHDFSQLPAASSDLEFVRQTHQMQPWFLGPS